MVFVLNYWKTVSWALFFRFIKTFAFKGFHIFTIRDMALLFEFSIPNYFNILTLYFLLLKRAVRAIQRLQNIFSGFIKILVGGLRTFSISGCSGLPKFSISVFISAKCRVVMTVKNESFSFWSPLCYNIFQFNLVLLFVNCPTDPLPHSLSLSSLFQIIVPAVLC